MHQELAGGTGGLPHTECRPGQLHSMDEAIRVQVCRLRMK